MRAGIRAHIGTQVRAEIGSLGPQNHTVAPILIVRLRLSRELHIFVIVGLGVGAVLDAGVSERFFVFLSSSKGR